MSAERRYDDLPVYSPDDLYRFWRNYDRLLSGPLGPVDQTRGAKTPKKRPVSDGEMRFAVRKADVDDLLARLRRQGWSSARSARAIAAYYKEHRPIHAIAAREHADERTIYQRIERGMRRMAQLSGWSDPEERARLHPFVDDPHDIC